MAKARTIDDAEPPMEAEGGYPTGPSYDEMFAPGGFTRPNYRLLRQRLRTLSVEALAER